MGSEPELNMMDNLQALTTPGRLPEFRVVGRGTDTDLLVQLEPAIRLRGKEGEEGGGG